MIVVLVRKMLTLKMCAMRAILRTWINQPPTLGQIEYIKMLWDRRLVTDGFIRVLRERCCKLLDECNEISRRSCSPYLDAMAAMAYYGMWGTEDDIGLGCGHDTCSDIRKIPSNHLRALLDRMKGKVELESLVGNLNIVFSSLTCETLFMKNLNVSRSNSQKILRMMQFGNLKELQLCNVQFEHIKHITAYNGVGTCNTIILEMSDKKLVRKMDDWQRKVGWCCIIVRMRGTNHQYQSILNAAMYKRFLTNEEDQE